MDSFVVKKKRRIGEQSTEYNSEHVTKKSKDDSTETDQGTGHSILWKEIRRENLCCDYTVFYSKHQADELLAECEKILIYNEGQMARVHLYGKWMEIARKQVAFGDEGLSYRFSGKTVSAQPWMPLVQKIKDDIIKATGYTFNFVLVNRYKDGHDHIGEHKDDEKDLVFGHPIASLSLGQARDFIFKHQDSRGKNATRDIPTVKLELQHGSLLMMKHPTNSFWYHSLPTRKKLINVRINFTFRQMMVNKAS
ncbi:DNA oxidative demethylase ALKBH2 [Patella vulgata]|uniref:DNA oxidative demethylase ALKBH2 n=1 Tax=Patella vulgata TaxID=6465 RepID=UPI00217F6617|nr:DNA oxidative demethylase ALKBH2 [Patella vulgata]